MSRRRQAVVEYSLVPSIRGRIVYEGGLRPSEFTYSRVTQEGERRVAHVEIDGERFVRAPKRDWNDCEVD